MAFGFELLAQPQRAFGAAEHVQSGVVDVLLGGAGYRTATIFTAASFAGWTSSRPPATRCARIDTGRPGLISVDTERIRIAEIFGEKNALPHGQGVQQAISRSARR
ncbi:hypothetical protein GCM10020366_70910 [Saccharopolyspora gregorii]|uniref:Uncharacterized protein n=1 Tax=Saccharopolyspora gregorii TaxID=33914 RepID=A0ABP6S306_9PSEU